MSAPPTPRVLLTGTAPAWLDEVRPVLEQAVGATAETVGPDAAAALDPTVYQLLAVAAEGRDAPALVQLFRRWRGYLGETYVPMLWLGSERATAATALKAGATAALTRPFPADELAQQSLALLRAQWLFGRAAARASEAKDINARLNQVYQQIDSDLELARHIHSGFLPKSFPEVHRARFAVCYRPRSRVGGDFYDVLRLDEEHVGFYVADAMGRGVPASSLLTIFLKKSVRTKEIKGRSYRLIPPDEVLAKLNEDLLTLGLPDPPLITVLYVQLNCRDGLVSFARAAHPIPLHVPKEGQPEFWPAPGPLLGVFEAEYPAQSRQLKPGEKLLLYSDGIHGGHAEAAVSEFLAASADRHRDEPIEPFVDAVARDLLEQVRQPDDITLLGLEFRSDE